MVTFNLATYDDDARENETSNSLDDYSYSTSYDTATIANYSTDIVNLLLRFENVTIPAGATITNAYFNLQCLQGSTSGVHDLVAYADIGATRQDVWGVSSRFETGFTPSTSGDTTSTSTLSVAADQQVACTAALQDLIDNANGGWNSGETARFAITINATYERGATFAMFNHNTGHDPSLVVTYTEGGGGDPEGRLIGGKLIRGGFLRSGVL